MDWKRDGKFVLAVVAVFLMFYFVPMDGGRVGNAATEALALVQWYVREHMLMGLLPALFIAGAVSAFVSKASVMRYLGAHASKFVSYAVASVSGCVLAVCSCTILPLFAGIYSRGAGLGPAT
ncbi:MAG: permease, partial [Candidatus Eisenbacteria bacterium]|nr:permease [Candidatus Eisenbacteria bacterium]